MSEWKVLRLEEAFRCNEVCVVSDGPGALCGTAFTPFEHFAPWNVDDAGQIAFARTGRPGQAAGQAASCSRRVRYPAPGRAEGAGPDA